MKDEGRDLTKEELEELQMDRAYCNATSMPIPKDEGYYSYLKWNPYYDSDYAKIIFIIGDIFTFLISVGLIFGGVVGQVPVCLWIGVASLALCIIGTIIRYLPNKKDVDSIMEEETHTQIILGTIIALHVTPLGLVALGAYLMSKEDEVQMKQIRKYGFNTACKNAKEYKDLYDALNFDYHKRKISDDDYMQSIFELKEDLNRYVEKLDEKVKVIESRITKGLADKKDLQKEIDFVNNEKNIAYSILNPDILKENEEENKKAIEEHQKNLSALIQEMEAKAINLPKEKEEYFKSYKSYYEKGIITIEDYYSRLQSFFEDKK